MAILLITLLSSMQSNNNKHLPFAALTPTSKMKSPSVQFETFPKVPESSSCTLASAGQRQYTWLYGLMHCAMRRSCTTIYRRWMTGHLGSSYLAQFELVQKWHITTPLRAQYLHCKTRLQLEARFLSGPLGPDWDLTSDRVPCTRGTCIWFST